MCYAFQDLLLNLGTQYLFPYVLWFSAWLLQFQNQSKYILHAFNKTFAAKWSACRSLVMWRGSAGAIIRAILGMGGIGDGY